MQARVVSLHRVAVTHPFRAISSDGEETSHCVSALFPSYLVCWIRSHPELCLSFLSLLIFSLSRGVGPLFYYVLEMTKVTFMKRTKGTLFEWRLCQEGRHAVQLSHCRVRRRMGARQTRALFMLASSLRLAFPHPPYFNAFIHEPGCYFRSINSRTSDR